MAASPEPTARHNWQFFRAGGFDQVLLESGQDLLALPSLDQKLWVALSCPVAGLEFDPRTLALIDSDQDGHIRVPEILSALAWAGARLKDPELLVAGTDGVPLDAIDTASEAGARLRASTEAMLARLDKTGSPMLSAADVAAAREVFLQSGANGDGVISAASTADADLQAWLVSIRESVGSCPDAGGEDGIDGERLAQFDAAVAAWQAWRAAGDLAAPLATTDPGGLATLWAQLAPKIDDYFLRCRLASYDPRAAAALSGSEEELQQLALRVLSTEDAAVAALPLGPIRAIAELDLTHGVNPAWAGLLVRFTAEVLTPLGYDVQRLSLPAWEELKVRFQPLQAWWDGRIAAPGGLPPERLALWAPAHKALEELLRRDLEQQPEAEDLVQLEMLTLYCRDLLLLANNFVSFRNFYMRRTPAIFQCGTLYLDGRSCELCVPVADTARHAALASLSRLFLVYCTCTRAGGKEQFSIAAAVTSGDTDQIMVGRNGIFYDRQGRDWDATIVRIVDHPISIRQAFWSPFKRIGRMIGDQLNKLAAAKSKATEERAVTAALRGGEEKAVAQQAFDVGKFAGIFAAIGLALGAIGTAVAAIVTGLFKLAWWQLPLVLLGALLLVSGPSMLIAWFKLRQRNLGPLLDANGWAVNARAKLNIPFGTALTGIARLPAGSRAPRLDPFAEKRWGLRFYLLLAALITAVLLFLWLGGA